MCLCKICAAKVGLFLAVKVLYLEIYGIKRKKRSPAHVLQVELGISRWKTALSNYIKFSTCQYYAIHQYVEPMPT
jgi:hypothetical protein